MAYISAVICDIKPNSLAEKAGLKAGDKIISVNGRELRDILDYQYASADEKVEILVMREGVAKTILCDNSAYEPLGISFDTSLFDGIKTCRNKCIFCFIDQLPGDMREAVYVKDDDYRLSFLYGNFVTLTNVDEADIERIIEDRISPLYISLHAADSQLRMRMLGRKKIDRTLEYMRTMSDAGIDMHVQIVLCPEVNDGKQLDRTLDELSEIEGVVSVGIVPVGLTAYRKNLFALRSFEKQEIIELVKQVSKRQEYFTERNGDVWVFLADEFYIGIGCELPQADHYGDYPQIENGIGLSRLFVDDAKARIDACRAESVRVASRESATKQFRPVVIATGELFAPVMEEIASSINCLVMDRIPATGCERQAYKHDDKQSGEQTSGQTTGPLSVIAVKNKFFGGRVNVTGLLTGYDIVEALAKATAGGLDAGQIAKGIAEQPVLAIPEILLNADGLLLDGYTPERISSELGMEVAVIKSNGAEAVEEIVELVTGKR
jgi:putative radical SAM enzyme (TIGR03279 family)